jgi:hypothetical protein
MMTWRSVGKVCLALGVCLLFLAIGTYQAHASCAGNVDCDQGGCVGSTPPCDGLGCSGSGSACYQCVCTPNPIYPPKCNCTY